MIREIVTIKDYRRLSQTYEHYLWHFVRKDQCETHVAIKPFLLETCEIFNPLDVILEYTNIPYFESYIEDSYDFLYNNGISINNLWSHHNFFNPILIGFNKSKFIKNTHETCYCSEGIIDIILTLGNQYMLNID